MKWMYSFPSLLMYHANTIVPSCLKSEPHLKFTSFESFTTALLHLHTHLPLSYSCSINADGIMTGFTQGCRSFFLFFLSSAWIRLNLSDKTKTDRFDHTSTHFYINSWQTPQNMLDLTYLYLKNSHWVIHNPTNIIPFISDTENAHFTRSM